LSDAPAPVGWPPLRAILVDLGYTLVSWDAPRAALLAGYAEAQALVATAHPTRPPPNDLVYRVARQVLAAPRAAQERGDFAESDHDALLAAALAESGYPLEPNLVRELAALEHAAFARHLAVPPANLAALGALREQGLRLALVSNITVPPALVQETLAALGLSPYFDAVVLSSAVGWRKPHPRIFQAALGRLGVGPEEALSVGDRVLEDVRGPLALGLRAVLTHEHRQEPPEQDVPVISRFAELPALLRRLETRPA